MREAASPRAQGSLFRTEVERESCQDLEGMNCAVDSAWMVRALAGAARVVVHSIDRNVAECYYYSCGFIWFSAVDGVARGHTRRPTG